MSQLRCRLIHGAIALACFSATTSQTFAADYLRTVALTGNPVPGAAPGAQFTEFERRINPAINNLGETAFQAFFAESQITKAAVLTEGGGTGLRVAASQTYHFESGTTFLHVLQALNDQGQTAYLAKVPPNILAGQPLDLYRDNGPGDTEVVAHWETPFVDEAPLFSELYPFSTPRSANGVSLSDAGQVVFPARAFDTNVAAIPFTGIWREDPSGELQNVVRVGGPAPGTSTNFVMFAEPPFVVANRAGRIAFIGRTEGGVGSLGIWTETSSGLLPIIRTGFASPGIDGATFSSFDALPGIGFNSQGHLSFKGLVSGTGITTSNRSGLWCDCGDGLELAVRQSDQAPGTSPGQIFADFNATALNARGDLAFVGVTGGTEGSGRVGLWSNAGGDGFELLAYPGIPAPGTEPDVVFQSLAIGLFNPILGTPLILNAHGQAAFMSSIAGPGVNDSNNSGIWAQDRAGILRLIARKGDQVNVSDDPLQPDWRTISSLLVGGFTGNDDGRRSWFNDRGQLAFFASFTDGSEGLLVSNLATLPEPNALTLLLLALTLVTPALAPRRRLRFS